MKRWLAALGILLIAAFFSTYIFIPSRLVINKITLLKVISNAVARHVTDTVNWSKWWPQNDAGRYSDSRGFFRFDSFGFRLQQTSHNASEIAILQADTLISSQALIVTIPGDSTLVEWKATYPTSLNPLTRYRQYVLATRIKESMDSIMANFTRFLSRPENVYGQLLTETTTKDTLLIATKSIINHYPSTAEIYSTIDHLTDYAKKNDCMNTGFPMLNVTKLDSGKFQVMIALPINKWLKEKADFFPSRMVPGKFISSEIRGGSWRVEEGIRQMQNYLADYKKISMAIPYQALETDRRAEPDSTKWVTRIYNPIFYHVHTK